MYYDDYEHSQYGYDDYQPETYNHNYQPVPDAVRKFLECFQKFISEGQVYKIQNLYENVFPKLSDTYFEKESWPDEKAVADIVHNDAIFLILYKELYYRHIYAKQPSPSLEQRFNSFYNYCEFFNYILLTETPVQLELPDVWLWELIDEFVYQFTSFTHFRASPNDKKTTDEIENLKQAQINKTWEVLCVLNVLHFLVTKSKIKCQLEIQASGGDPSSVAGNFGEHPLYKMLGFYALTGLLRLHCLLGDYYQAIKVLEGVELFKNNEHTRVPGCQISTAYYAGFAYIMMRRYSDAIRTFSASLLYIQRTKQMFTTKSYQNAQINKQTESMYTLLAICLVLHPQCIDEGLQQALSESNYNEMYYKMQIGDMDEFKKAFESSCPKFLSLQTPSPENPGEDFTKEAIAHQTQVFMDEVYQQKMLTTIRSYLKLYTTLPLNKLTTFMCSGKSSDGKTFEMDKDALIINLLCFKHKMKNIVSTKGVIGLEGKFQSGSELDFYIDHDMIHIADTKVAHRYGDFFIRRILKFEDLSRKLHAIKI